MTHLWKTQEVYYFDMPAARIQDVYGKNARLQLWPYLKFHCPKITKIRFGERMPGLYVEVDHPKYSEEHPYFTPDDIQSLLTAYMDYANMTWDELSDWYNEHSVAKTFDQKSSPIT